LNNIPLTYGRQRLCFDSMPADRSSRKEPRPGRARPQTGHADLSHTHELERAEDDPFHVRDPRGIRALAHPARMVIIDALASGDELTATECAELTGLSPSATAYHLKMLQRYAFAEPAPARDDGRERPWRATSRRASFDLDSSTPAGAAATTAVALAFFDRSRALAEEFVATERDEPEEWQDVAVLTNIDVWLSVEETQGLTAALAAVIEPFRDRTLGNRPEGSRRVRVMTMVTPH
jgi:DNA-binding transcriptional ArsR family regulator